jgi:hypothetical protein
MKIGVCVVNRMDLERIFTPSVRLQYRLELLIM